MLLPVVVWTPFLPFDQQLELVSRSCQGSVPMSLTLVSDMYSGALFTGVIGYQKERHARLVQAYDIEKSELSQLEEELKDLQKQIKEARSGNSFYLDTVRALARDCCLKYFSSIFPSPPLPHLQNTRPIYC